MKKKRKEQKAILSEPPAPRPSRPMPYFRTMIFIFKLFVCNHSLPSAIIKSLTKIARDNELTSALANLAFVVGKSPRVSWTSVGVRAKRYYH